MAAPISEREHTLENRSIKTPSSKALSASRESVRTSHAKELQRKPASPARSPLPKQDSASGQRQVSGPKKVSKKLISAQKTSTKSARPCKRSGRGAKDCVFHMQHLQDVHNNDASGNGSLKAAAGSSKAEPSAVDKGKGKANVAPPRHDSPPAKSSSSSGGKGGWFSGFNRKQEPDHVLPLYNLPDKIPETEAERWWETHKLNTLAHQHQVNTNAATLADARQKTKIACAAFATGCVTATGAALGVYKVFHGRSVTSEDDSGEKRGYGEVQYVADR